jgi:thiamine pyrophosphokinase
VIVYQENDIASERDFLILNFKYMLGFKKYKHCLYLPRSCYLCTIWLLPFLLLHQVATFSTQSSPISRGSSLTTIGMTTLDERNDDINMVIQFSSPVLTADSAKSKTEADKNETTILIILNYPIHERPSLWFEHLWKVSDERICADGGANRLYQYSKDYIPDRIRGDLDSLDPTVRDYYEKRNVLIEQDICQDTNDLDKALQVSVLSDNDCSARRIVVYGAFGGRFDQEMASLQALYNWSPKLNWQLYLYSEETCAFLIPANRDCEIRYPFYDKHNLEDDTTIDAALGEGPTCGLIPLGGKVDSIVTKGLKWDLDGMSLEFGGLVSTSNRIMYPVVNVYASHPVVFTAELLTRK